MGTPSNLHPAKVNAAEAAEAAKAKHPSKGDSAWVRKYFNKWLARPGGSPLLEASISRGLSAGDLMHFAASVLDEGYRLYNSGAMEPDDFLHWTTKAIELMQRIAKKAGPSVGQSVNWHIHMTAPDDDDPGDMLTVSE
jgi:hypothetical protein